MSERSALRYVFGEFSLDPVRRSFTKSGKELHLPAKEFDTLLYFIENRGRALSKDEMMSAIWDDTFVEEGNLAQYVSRLRKLLGSNGHNYIQTLPKKGYRFEAEVKVFEAAAVSSHRPGLLIAAVVGVLVLAAAFVWWAVSSRVPKPAPAETKDNSTPIALTDGKQDDGAVAWTNDNHIRYFHRVSPNRMESWIMNLDGSDQHREVIPVKDFLSGMWSPDGKKVFFMKDGDNKTTYLANSDGSGEITLPLLVGNSDWSPDSSKFVYETKVAEGNTDVFLYSLATRQNLNLTHSPFFDADPSFTPDGQHIVFLSGRDGNADIYMMDLTGKIERRLTDHPAFDNFPSVSPDGTQLLFFSNRDGGDAHMYLRNLNDDSPPVRVTDFPNVQGTHAKCWSPDGTQVVFTSDVGGKDQIYLMNSEPYPARQLLSDENADLQFPRVSPDGSKLIYQARMADHSIELRITEISSNSTKTIFKTDPGLPVTLLLTAEWSPDGGAIVFDSKTSDNSRIFLMNANGSDVHALTNGELPDFCPSFSSDGKEILFARDFYGKPKLYRMDLDGTNARPLNSKEGYEQSQVMSPNGNVMLYSADRLDGRKMGLDIYATDLLHPDDERLLISRPMHDASVVFSPNGKRIAFTAQSDDNSEIYVANSDGTGLFRVTRNKANDSAPTFLADDRRIIFSSDRGGKFAIYEIDLSF